MKTSREEVYKVIDGEREYQKNFIEPNPDRHQGELDHSVGDFIVMLTSYVREAQENWTRHGGVEKSLNSIRKIAAIAVNCMEDHGAPKRNLTR